ncbi:MAG: hypothetical protein EA385_15280 [Salinarimonadaceae bacterium]|nr:MAG: hypothetical protein EA385_15280 [Salinarimonadaceae bacterium]
MIGNFIIAVFGYGFALFFGWVALHGAVIDRGAWNSTAGTVAIFFALGMCLLLAFTTKLLTGV